uniref:Uncharacterized protein n=1 Tax=Magallana gigas TaxID=29159 RepID=A0A8W8J570_MAGGI
MDADKDTYQFHPERTHQGLALVIANFTEGEDRRGGADSDLKYMKKTFKRLGFKVDCHKNVTKSDLVSLLNGCSQHMLTSYDCFVFAISSHGMEFVQKDKMGNSVQQHVIKMFDGEYIYTKDILDYFTDRKCKALKNKPKLFFIQACRIPETKSTHDQYDAGVGFDSGISTHNKKGGQDQRTTRDKTDFGGSSGGTETDSDEESDVSDTDVEEDESSLSDSDIEPTAKGQGAGGNGDSNSHSAADENENASGVTADLEDDIDPAKRRRLYPLESGGSGDDIDPARGRKIYPPAPLEFTLVPCHNDMLIMFASPQGHYAFRNKTDGSYMLQLLYKCVEKYYANGGLAQNQTNFLDVLRDVTTQMSEMKFMGSKEYTIVPCIVHKLRKDVIFTQGKSMGSTKFTFKLSEIISTLGMSFFTWSNKN